MPKNDEAAIAARVLERVENEAEFLVVNQLDLLAQLELQMRLVNRCMRQIEKLRNARYRVGPELTPRQRDRTLTNLKAELTELDEYLGTQQESCKEMHATIDAMRKRLRALLTLKARG
jgi:chaperonin cofactor prefoldin